MKSFRMRLTLAFVVLIGSSVLVAGILVANMLRQSHIEVLGDSLVREIQIMQKSLNWKQDGDLAERRSYFNKYAVELKQNSDLRVTFLDVHGVVLGDSDEDPERMDNHASRPEIVDAGNTGLGLTVRHSSTLGTDMLYTAVPVVRDNQRIGYVRLSMSLHNIDSSTAKLWSYLIAGLLALFVIAGLVGYRIAQGLTRPLEKATEVAKQITRMNYKSRVEVKSRDEFGQLGQAINKMASSLQFQMNRIKEEERRLKNVLDNMISGVLTVDRMGRIALVNRSAELLLGFTSKELLGKKYDKANQQTELTEMIRVCQEKREPVREEIVFYFPEERTVDVNAVPIDADEEWGVVIVLHDITAIRRLEKMRSEFVANVSHELKTPITAIKGFAETLLGGAVQDRETAEAFLQIIHDESDRLNRLIEDILQLSKIESKKAPMYFAPVHMASFAAQTMEMMESTAAKRNIRLEKQLDDEIYLEADEDRLRQILINLLSNGINYTPEGGIVKLIVEPVLDKDNGEYDHVRIIVKDTGIGIPKSDVPRIFERFYRVDKARSRGSGGTGLGLSIVKHLVELHRGTIRVESMVGAGSSFIIELPVLQ
ncbi:two-component system histidine kinase PnpS [Ferviditalea candida]|uniref:histidine kinase n=1 Tax=Ferviditalea candida TaxID=3108399 RepID=A0ABU5ZDE4_9BACL|nr:ATP-binding protein [Paenibacillaceae bacterium T2]